jgi:hypothetical protein
LRNGTPNQRDELQKRGKEERWTSAEIQCRRKP